MTVDPYRDVSPGDDVPHVVNTIVEIARGGTVKYELDKETGLLKMDRVLFSAVHFPANYGFIPQTLAEDDDPLDILVLCQFGVQPMTLMKSRPIGCITMIDAGKNDHKIIAVATGDPEYNTYQSIDDLPVHRAKTLQRFFRDYKTLEDASVEVREVEPIERAHEIIRDAVERFV